MAENIAIRPVLSLPILQGELTLVSQPTQTTVGAAGGATALPATPTGYLRFIIEGVERQIPFYAVS